MLFLISGIVSAEQSPDLIWIVIDRLGIEEFDIENYPNINKLQQKGAFSLMNVRTADDLTSESTYLSAGSGNRCQGSKTNTYKLTVDGPSFLQNIDNLKKVNKNTYYHADIGKLGKFADNNQIKIGVLGNSDTIDKKGKNILTMVMNQQGYVPLADVSKGVLKINNKYPWKYETDWTILKNKYNIYKRKVDALFIETGDIGRIDNYSCLLSKEDILSYKRKALKKIDEFIGFIIEDVKLNKTQLGLIIPTPSHQALTEGKKLSWVAFCGGSSGRGWIKTDSTRKNGVTTIADLLTIFKYNFADKTGTINILNKIDFTGKNISWDRMILLNRRISFISNIRPFMVKVFILFQLILIILAIVKSIWKKAERLIIFDYFFEYLLLSLFLTPINYIFISLLNIFSLIYLILIFLLLTSVELIIILKFIDNKLMRVLVINWSLLLIISYDLLSGYQLLSDTILGYSSIIGARYYGLGNEYMGFYIGCYLIGITGSLELKQDRQKINNSSKIMKNTPLLTLIFIYFIGAPNLGANFGGTVTALTAVVITFFNINKEKFWMSLAIAILLFLLIVTIDFTGLFGVRSHIGQAVSKIIKGDWGSIWLLIFRKLKMNLKLLRWTIWTRVVLAFIIYLIILVRRPGPEFKKLFNSKPFLTAGFYGCLAGSLTAMVVNDSGIVAAATILFYPILTLLYILNK
ncbi:MAG: hypothetical protein ACOCRZ_01485 [Halothermotrichaceae bacterium]